MRERRDEFLRSGAARERGLRGDADHVRERKLAPGSVRDGV